MQGQPLISVVTPFHNTASYLDKCIESVLKQSYPCFEYILVDNCSTDGSTEIAEAYARCDPRIRLVRRTQFVSQVQNYNGALAEISDASSYCKMVQADDHIFPECLEKMTRAFQQSETIGLVSSYWLKGNRVHGVAFPYGTSQLSGREVARMYLRQNVYLFGSPTTVMYRSSLVRGPQPFFDERLLHEDTEKCMQILGDWDFGFVHQVLSFLRTDNVNDSISAGVRVYHPDHLDNYIITKRYSPVFLESQEAAAVTRESKEAYYRVLAEQAVQLRGRAFWRYHGEGLKTVGESLDRLYLFLKISQVLLWMLINPGLAVARLFRSRKRKQAVDGRAAQMDSTGPEK